MISRNVVERIHVMSVPPCSLSAGFVFKCLSDPPKAYPKPCAFLNTAQKCAADSDGIYSYITYLANRRTLTCSGLYNKVDKLF